MLVVTLPFIQGTTLTKVHGVVSTETILGMNFLKDYLAGFTDVIGGKSGVMERGFKQAREDAIARLKTQAEKLGANAILGLDIDIAEFSGKNKSMIMVLATGTAVNLVVNEDEEEPASSAIPSEQIQSTQSTNKLPQDEFTPKTKYGGW